MSIFTKVIWSLERLVDRIGTKLQHIRVRSQLKDTFRPWPR